MKLGYLTEQRKNFVEAYCRLGNGTFAAKEAEYKVSPTLANQASKLKRELSREISKKLSY
jgi:phage terminase small subunit